MFRRLVIAFITAVAALLETAADAIAATLPPPTVDSPQLRVVAPGRLCLQLPELTGAEPFQVHRQELCVVQAVQPRHAVPGQGEQGAAGGSRVGGERTGDVEEPGMASTL